MPRIRVSSPCLAVFLLAFGLLFSVAMVKMVSNATDGKSEDKNGKHFALRVMTDAEESSLRQLRTSLRDRPNETFASFTFDGYGRRRKELEQEFVAKYCRYRTWSNLTSTELSPVADERHMIDPPRGGLLSHVCCQTTAGPLNILARHKWAPRGAGRFVDMVKSGYFASEVPLMRCIEGFICQFGIHGNIEVSARHPEFSKSMKDDPQWLPAGPKYRMNEKGVKRFSVGYLAYAGSGKDSRGNQLIIGLKSNGPLAGGSPWEVPWGEIVGQHSFHTLANIHTGYGENGPSQAILRRQGADEEVRKNFTKLDYIQKCVLLDENDHSDILKLRK